MILDGFDILAFLAAAAFLAGFVDSIAGGGGLITVPVLLLAGLSPIQALGTNKLQSLFGAATATIAYARNGHVNLAQQWKSAALSGVASAVGAWLISNIPNDAVRTFIPFLLIAIALFFWLKPGLSDDDRAQRITPFVFTAVVVPIIGFYDGFFGPGTGSFFMIAFITLAGFGVLKATAHTKLLNFASNFGAFLVFAVGGAVLWKIGLVMGVAQIAGAQCGSYLAMKNGAKLIKPLIIITCLALAVKLLADTYI
ncbi:MAG: TSUP family transporter [Ahrensia sp.]|nr:TSUP family transporter [Ahrensia sp.]